jgi:hypothetical protein
MNILQRNFGNFYIAGQPFANQSRVPFNQPMINTNRKVLQ